MFSFIVKKTFYDVWDNLLTVVVVNLLTLLLGLSIYIGCSKLITNLKTVGNTSLGGLALFALFLFIAFLFLSIVNFSFGELASEITNYNGIKLKAFFTTIPSVFKDALLFSLLCTALTVVSIFCFDFYFLKMQSIFGFLVGSLLIWIDIFVIFSFQWFIPIRSLMKNNFKKCLKKSFLIFFDNTAFSFGIGLHNLIMGIVSVFLLGTLPSFAGLMIFKTNALKLRLYKYDYLEEHPELTTRAERRAIPWEELIYDDKEIVGSRTLKNLIFPWKDGEQID